MTETMQIAAYKTDTPNYMSKTTIAAVFPLIVIGKREHTEETKRKMSEAAKRHWVKNS